MTRSARKFLSLICAILLYYIVHEGAHLCAALLMGTFRRIRITGFGLGVQIVADTAAMSDMQVFLFCIVGALAALVAGYILFFTRRHFLKAHSAVIRAVAYYATLALLMTDPIYLSILYWFVGGGDMNGITQLGVPALPVSVVFLAVGIVNLLLIIKYIYPDYKKAYEERP